MVGGEAVGPAARFSPAPQRAPPPPPFATPFSPRVPPPPPLPALCATILPARSRRLRRLSPPEFHDRKFLDRAICTDCRTRGHRAFAGPTEHGPIVRSRERRGGLTT